MATSELTEHQDVALRTWLPGQRWYGDKSRYLDHVAMDELMAVEIDRGLVTVALLTCSFDDGARSTYFAPILWDESGAGDGSSSTLQDAFTEPEFLAWLYSGFADARTVDVADGRRLRWIPGAAFRPVVAVSGHGQVLGAEQSNTSVRFENEAILKVFRKVQRGINPDPEILRFLSTHSGYRQAPADFGTIELQQSASSEPVVIGAMQAFIANSGDAWTWLLDQLRSLHEATVEQVLAYVSLLGHRTGDLHLALATPTDDPAFSVKQISDAYREHLHRRIDGELSRTLDTVRVRGLRTGERLSRLERRLTDMLADNDMLNGFALSRVHGDFHLGQVLKTEDDFVIIDFEGEPSRPFHERREKGSPLKDVAGMLRSLDYAIATVGSETSDPEHRDRLARFGRLATQAYTETYRSCLSAKGGGLVPVDADRFDAALSIFLIEKALYEVRYELDNRPNWVEIPLAALEALAVS